MSKALTAEKFVVSSITVKTQVVSLPHELGARDRGQPRGSWVRDRLGRPLT